MSDDPKISDYDPDGDMVTAALDSVGREIAKREAVECRGAWRAGYDYLYVIEDKMNVFRRSYIPSNREKWPHSSDVSVKRFDVGAVDDDEMRTAIREYEGSNSAYGDMRK